MKPIHRLTTLLLILFAVYWCFRAEMPVYEPDVQIEKSAFSTDRALKHVERISEKPHSVGFPAHSEVRRYIIGELQKLGLETQIQEGYTAGDWANYSKAINILARIEGSEDGKALLLMSHYDSSPHSSLGASDAGSGVATILEGLRAYLSIGEIPKNDIIILITDAEELGLNGADLFVNEHPWAKETGLVLNFEARGSGGPGYMLLETNQGNSTLIKEFVKADPAFPVSNSLAYSIYKMLPNDTDLTVFREDGDIEGFNFAFIDDHFDYHTVRDSPERLDKNTLAHQGSYLMPLLVHFSQADLNNLKSPVDYVYFNVPFFKLVSYPFKWIWPMFGLAFLAFILLLVHGFRREILNGKEILLGFLPWLFSFVINAAVGYLSWPVLKWMYPQYQDILHGFTYNGYTYIAAFVFFSITICFFFYHKFRKINVRNLLVAPIVIWLGISLAVAIYLPGASFFIVPVFALLASFMVVINQKEPNAYLLVFLALPAIWIHAPLIKMLPVGLGLKLMIGTTVSLTNLFLLLLPVLGFYKKKNRLAFLSLILFIGFMVSAHFDSGFSKENAKQTSLAYILEADSNTATWVTYEKVTSDWTARFIKRKQLPEKSKENSLSSKYGTGFTFTSEAPLKEILPPKVEKTKDTIVGNERLLEICITPQRPVNRLEVFTNAVSLNSAKINGIALQKEYLGQRTEGRLFTHYISNNDYTELQVMVSKDEDLTLTFYEASNNLLSHPQFSVPERPEDNIPMPFVLNDAILVVKTVSFE